MKPIQCLCVFMMAVAFVMQGFGQIPRVVAYQGVLSDTLGNPKPDGTYSLTFRLYQATSGGSALWIEQKTLTVRKGLFSTNLGDQVVFPASMRFDVPYYLSIQVAAGPELSPRLMLAPGAYTLTADSARVAGGLPPNSITAGNVVDQSLTGTDILDEPGLNVQEYRSLNTMYPLPAWPDYLCDTLTMSAPAAGYALVFGSATVVFNHTNGVYDNVVVGIAKSSGLVLNYSERPISLAAGYPAGEFRVPVEIFQAFTVAPGINRFYMSAGLPQGANASILQMTMTAIYFPTRYGTGSVLSSPAPEDGVGNSVTVGAIPANR